MTVVITQEAAAWAESHRAAGRKVVSVNGCFDILHAGHVATLERARGLGDRLIVLLNSDVSIRRLKGPARPYLEQDQRAAVLGALRAVDRVLVFDGDTPLPELAVIRPDIHVKGGSFVAERVEAERALLAGWGGRVELLPLVPGVSTTGIARRIQHRVDGKGGEAGGGSGLVSPAREAAARSRAGAGSRYPALDRSRVVTLPFGERTNLVSVTDFAAPPASGAPPRFLDILPATRHRTNAAANLVEVVHGIRAARARGKSITWACGPHLVKYGLSRHLVALMQAGLVTHVATNGAGAIHDAEIALFGATSEEMSGRIHTGAFGMARETGHFLNDAARQARDRGAGYGETLGYLLADAPHAGDSLLAQAFIAGIPMTIHVAIGTDIVHMHPSFDGAATGAASQRDFEILAAGIDNLSGGGVHLNVASSVVLPEVFLKSLTMANNLRRAAGRAPVQDFLAVTVDHESEYRPLMNVVRRPTGDLGKGIELLGRIEILVPLIAALLLAPGEAQLPGTTGRKDFPSSE